MLKSVVQGLYSSCWLLLVFFCATPQAFSKDCGLALSDYRGSLVPRNDPNLRAFLVDVLRNYRKGITGKNENLKHTRRMVALIRENADVLRNEGLDPSLLEVGIFLSDVAKNPALIEKYKKDYGDNAFAAFLDHARLGIVEGFELKENHKISNEQWDIIVEVVVGHDGPNTPGSWWKNNFKSIVGYKYPNITPHSKYAYVHALLDRMDQGGLYRDQRRIYQGGVRKISFDKLKEYIATPSSRNLRQSIEYSLNHIYPGSLLQVNDLLNQQANFFPNGIPLFLTRQIARFQNSHNVKDAVDFVGDEIHFINKNDVLMVLTPTDDGHYLASGTETSMTPSQALQYFWDQL